MNIVPQTKEIAAIALFEFGKPSEKRLDWRKVSPSVRDYYLRCAEHVLIAVQYKLESQYNIASAGKD